MTGSAGCQTVAWGAWLILASLVGPEASLRTGRAQDRSTAKAPMSQAALDARIATLIQQLGAPECATREKAQGELERIRADAFDALNEAQFNDDIEIALRARYLVRSMRNWSSEDDALEVKQLLRGYGNRPESERKNLLEQLVSLGPERSLRPLCRLVRYEASEKLSKWAALLTLGLEVPVDEPARLEYASNIQAMVGKSKRAAADWLRAYGRWLESDPDARQRFNELTAGERELLAQSPDQSSREITRRFLLWYAEQLLERGFQENALGVMRQTIALLTSRRQEVLEAVDWFRTRESWLIIVEIAERFPDTFERSPMLLYRLAGTYVKMGQQAKADAIARQALESVDAGAEKHVEIAANLQHDGLFEWAEREYRHVAVKLKDEPDVAIRARLYLSEMLHDTGRESAAGDVLKELVKAIESDEGIRDTVESDLGRDVASIKSRMLYFFAQHHAQQKDYQKQRETLLEGIQNDPQDADVLIAMFRVPDADATWKEQASSRVRAAADVFRKQITDLRDRIARSRSFEEKALATFQLALANNQLAWLISNTEGDFSESLKCSLRSLELQPNRAGFLDTLGRCYYAKGDYAKAVESQSKAIALEPHSPQMLAQLVLFKEALARHKTTAAPSEKEQ